MNKIPIDDDDDDSGWFSFILDMPEWEARWYEDGMRNLTKEEIEKYEQEVLKSNKIIEDFIDRFSER